MVDYNQSLDVAEALIRCRALDGEGLDWIEEPAPADDLEGCARIAELVRHRSRSARTSTAPWRCALPLREGERSRHAGRAVHPRRHRLARGRGARAHGGLPMSSHTFVEVSTHLWRHADGTLARGDRLRGRSAPRTTDVARRRGEPWDTPGIGSSGMRKRCKGTGSDAMVARSH